MSEPENFLSRWSRRKREAEQTPEPTPEADGAAPDAVKAPATTGAPAAPTTAEPTFDLASLPSLESIGAETDISLFMKPGVPAALRHAALRRAWTGDPAIRDFRGLQESDWDFNAPDGIPGFGTFNSDVEIKNLAARLFGTHDEASEPVSQTVPTDRPTETPLPIAEAESVELDKIQRTAQAPGATTSDDAVAAATQQSDERQEEGVTARKHGGALPH
jgi:hypothetical protein